MDKPGASICPYLGSWRDPLTAYRYPTSANCCNAGENPAETDKENQEEFCLTPNHATCAQYVARINAPSRPG